MISLGKLPTSGIFTITDDMKQEYIKIYASINGNGIFGKKSNKSYAAKLAGLSLLKLNKSREEKINTFTKVKEKTKSGIVYIISNEAFPDYYKVGMTQDLTARLKSYQTYDPLKRYKVEHYKVVSDARTAENYYLTHHSINIRSGEWVKEEQIKDIFLE